MAQESNINNNPNQALLGLNTDNTSQQIKPGQLTYALNAQIDSFDGNMITYQNEQSNVLCSEFKTGYRVIGIHNIVEQNRAVIFLVNPYTGDSEIGLLSTIISCDVDEPTNLNQSKSSNYVNNGYNNIDSECDCKGSDEILTFYQVYKKLNPKSQISVNSCCSYRTLVNARCLSFNINNPIHNVEHRIVDQNDDANKCGTEIYWTDGLNPRRFLNLDDLPYETLVSGCERVQSNIIDCDLLEVQPTIKPPCITTIAVSDGGSTIAGTYQFAMQYANDKGEGYSAYYSVTNPLSVTRKDYYGFNFNFETDKSIKIRISNLDTKFKYYNLIVIKTINGATDIELVGTYSITGETTELVYTGNNRTQINLTPQDVFQKFPYYKTAQGLTKAGDTIIYSNLKSDKRLSYQSIANLVEINWVTYQIPYTQYQSYENGVNTSLYRGYMRDEVYAFEICFLLKNGQQTDSFHIPGRVAISSDLTLISNEDVIREELDSCSQSSSSQPRWKVYNTATKTGFTTEYLTASDPDCYMGPYEYGKMAYWESTKTYECNKNVWGDLAGKPIRHHKFPDSLITHIHDKNTTTTNKEFDHKIYPIGIRVDRENIRQAILNSDLTDNEKSQIVGYKILRSDRVNNKSIIAKGLLYNVGVYTPYSEGSPSANQSVFYPNYPFNDLGDDPFLTNLSSISDGGFSISILDNLANKVDVAMQQADTVQSMIAAISAVCYSATSKNNCGVFPAIIEIENSEIADLQNKLFIANQYGKVLMNRINEILAYYQSKIDNGEGVCQDDVANMTLDSDLVYDFINSINDIDTSDAITNFRDIITYITTNANTLNSHPNANEIFELRTNLISVVQANDDLQTSKPLIEDNYNQWLAALVELSDVSCDDSVVVDSAFSRSRFTFHSPDTSFYQPYLGTFLKFETVEGGSSIGNFEKVKNHAGAKLMSAFSAGIALASGIALGALFALEPKLQIVGAFPGPIKSYYLPPIMPSIGTVAEKSLYWNQQFKTLIENLLPYRNYAHQYNAVGYYNTFNTIPNSGNKQRMLDKAYYLTPGMQTLGDIYSINNWKRESSVYFRTNQSFTAPLFPNDPSIRGSLPEDNSRVSYSSSKQIYSNILSYYASNKRKIEDQYGDLYSYELIDTGYCGVIDIKQSYTGQYGYVFGGDVFINRFGLKKKLSYFIDTNVGKPDGTDIEYSDLSNVGRVKYWYNTSSTQTPGSGFKGLMKSILNVPQSKLDGNTNKLFYQNGRIYLYSYGIAYFFVESEVNVDYRQAGNNTTHDFFPHVGTGIPNDWLQETNVPIVHDNYYIYNKTYSKQNKENYFNHLPLNFDPNQECQQDYSYRIIYSDPNKWRIYKPLAYKDLPRSYGKLTSIDTINNNAVMVRFENKTFVYNVLQTIQTSSGQATYLGNTNFFSAPPVDFGETDLGYAGSQHNLLLRTEAGHLYIDAKRGSIFLISGNSPTPISNEGKSKWFAKNLEFEIQKHYPQVNIDNHFNGIGITGVWDSQYERFIITKLDYAPLNQYKKDITYDSYYGKFYYKNQEVLLSDTRYFCNRSFTISYSPKTKSWISMHSYIPNYYIGLNGLFISGINSDFNNQKSSNWIHNLTHTSYQRFYGKLEPYVLEYPFVFKAQDEILQGVKDYTTVREYYNANDFYDVNDGIYFNKAILYNGQQCSGVRNLYPKPKGKMNLYFNYPKTNKDSIDILYTKSEGYYNYNQIWDVVKNPNNHYPIWTESCKNKSIDNELNNDKLDYSDRSFQKTKLRAKDLKVRHINDIFDRYRFISKFLLTSTQISYK
jgi:hypothetical protein